MIELPEFVRQDVDNSFSSGHPMTVSAVTPDGLPTVSFRGTTQVLRDDALAIWVRNPEKSTLLKSIAKQPTVVVIYMNMQEMRFSHFTGRASVIEDAVLCDRVFENSPELERKQDPERTGAAVEIELDAVWGRGPDGIFHQARS